MILFFLFFNLLLSRVSANTEIACPDSVASEDIIQSTGSAQSGNNITLSLEKGSETFLKTLDYDGTVYIEEEQFPVWLKGDIAKVRWSSLVFLDLKTISASQMKVLSRFSGEVLHFSALEAMQPAAAQKLSRLDTRKTIFLPSIQALSPRALSSLAKNKQLRQITIGIQDLSPEQIQALSGAEAKIIFPEIHSLSQETAEALIALLEQNTKAKHALNLHFPNLEHLSPELAQRLLSALLMEKNGTDFFYHKVSFNIPMLNHDLLTFLQEFSKPHRSNRHWSQDPNKIFSRAKNLSADAIDWRLSTPGPYQQRIHPHQICSRSVRNLTQIEADTAHKILEICSQQTLAFENYAEIPTEILTILLTHDSTLSFPQLTTISAEQAEIISRSKAPHISLQSLCSIEKSDLMTLSTSTSVGFSHSFIQQPEVFSILFPAQISVQKALGFSTIPNIVFEEIPHLSPDTVKTLDLMNITHLSPQQARLISQFQGEGLRFKALQWQPEIANALASFSGKDILIFQFSQQDLVTLQPLQEFQGEEIQILKIDQLSAEGLETLSRFKVEKLDLGFMSHEFDLLPLSSYPGALEINEISYHQNLALFFQDFQGKSLRIERIDLVTTEMIQAISSSSSEIHLNQIEAIEPEIIEIIRQHPQKTFHLNYADQEFCQLGNIESEPCETMKEIEESLEYWENHDCSEEEEHEH